MAIQRASSAAARNEIRVRSGNLNCKWEHLAKPFLQENVLPQLLQNTNATFEVHMVLFPYSASAAYH
jgi:hypothetical protein